MRKSKSPSALSIKAKKFWFCLIYSKKKWVFFFLLVGFYSIVCGGQAHPIQLNPTTAELISAYETVTPGQSFWIALKIKTDPGWHVYWKNPGDSGMAPVIHWQLLPGLVADPIQWLPPKKIKIAHLVNFGYEGDVYFPIKIQNNVAADREILRLKATVNWLACKETCVPQQANLSTVIRIGSQAQPSLFYTQLSAKKDELTALKSVTSRMTNHANFVRMHFSKNDLLVNKIKSIDFFPDQSGWIDPGVHVLWSDNAKEVTVRLKSEKPLSVLTGLLKVRSALTPRLFFSVCKNGTSRSSKL